MNIFELSAVASPASGAIAGGAAVKTSGIVWVTLGTVAGLGMGVALFFGAIALSGLLARFCMAQKLNPLQWFASMTAVLLPAVSPFAAWGLTIFVVSRVLHL